MRPNLFYKFVGGKDDDVVKVFDSIFLSGTFKFGSALAFNDPFEFKFTSIGPTSKAQVEEWHSIHDKTRSASEVDNAWSSFSGGGTRWNTTIAPRSNLLSTQYVLCLSGNWANHLMWAHYAAMHRGFCAVIDDTAIEALMAQDDVTMAGYVTYSRRIPELRWFSDTPNEMLNKVIFSKSEDWRYEEEYRITYTGRPKQPFHLISIPATTIRGIILGARAPSRLVEKALELKATRSDFSVTQICSSGESFDIKQFAISKTERRLTDIL